MRIGIDFDNTLVNYDNIFQSISVGMGLENVGPAKDRIKSHFQNIPNGLKQWKQIQALVYGVYIKDAYFLPDFIDFCNFAKENNIGLSIISYKTKYAFTGNCKVSLHEAANTWIQKEIEFFPKEDIYLESTMKGKIARISSLNLDFYFDDLISVFMHRSFPKDIIKVLFANPLNSAGDERNNKYEVVKNWTEAIKIVKEKNENISSVWTKI